MAHDFRSIAAWLPMNASPIRASSQPRQCSRRASARASGPSSGKKIFTPSNSITFCAPVGDASDDVAPEIAVEEHAVHEQGDRIFPAFGVRDLAELGAYALFSCVMGRTFALNSATFTDRLSV
jgi:hypothetical protein